MGLSEEENNNKEIGVECMGYLNNEPEIMIEVLMEWDGKMWARKW
jgi:hypothetical protein